MGSIATLVDIAHMDPVPGRPADATVAEVAARQGGVISRAQLIAIGLGPGAILHRIEAGRLHHLHPGVFAVGHSLVMERGLVVAALLAVGPGSLASHTTAAALWRIMPGRAQLHVSAPGRRRRRRRGIVVHQPRHLEPEDSSVHEGIPVTSVARTLLDVAGEIGTRQLERAFEEADRLRILDLASVRRLCDRTTGRRGLGRLRRLVDEALAPDLETRSELERRFLALCGQGGFPRPLVNSLVEGFEVDAYWPDARLAIELDGYEWHRTREAFENDRARDATLQVAGIPVVRFTDRQLNRRPTEVIDTLRALRAAGLRRSTSST